MTDFPTYTAFVGPSRLHTGSLPELLKRVKAQLGSSEQPLLIFEDATGRSLDFDFSGSLDDVLARALPIVMPSEPPSPRPGPGRPKLGVVSREVSLLPRHWDWLEGGRGGASATLRRLIDEARKADPEGERRRQATEAAGRFMTVMAGDLPGYEEASRALYAGDAERLREHVRRWPQDVQAYLLTLAGSPISDQL